MLQELPDHVPRAPRQVGTLLVLTPKAQPAYDTTRMAYSLRPYEVAYFRDHEWAEAPSQMLQPLLVWTLQQTGFFRATLTPPARGRTSYILDTDILELIQDFTVRPPVLRAAVRLQLLGPAGEPIASRDIAVRETMPEANPESGIVAANRAMAKILGEAARFVLNSVH